MKPFTTLTGEVAAMAALSLITVNSRGAELSLKIRTPDETKEIDRDDNGKTDTYEEKYVLSDDVTLSIHERLDEASNELQVRFIAITFRGKPIWHESYNQRLQERMTTAERQSRLSVHSMSSSKTGEVSVYLFDENDGLVATLIGEQDGRLAPVTDEELQRLRKLGEAATEFATDVLERPDELMGDKDEAGKVVQKLKQAVDEYNQDADDSTEKSIKSENENKAEESTSR